MCIPPGLDVSKLISRIIWKYCRIIFCSFLSFYQVIFIKYTLWTFYFPLHLQSLASSYQASSAVLWEESWQPWASAVNMIQSNNTKMNLQSPERLFFTKEISMHHININRATNHHQESNTSIWSRAAIHHYQGTLQGLHALSTTLWVNTVSYYFYMCLEP